MTVRTLAIFIGLFGLMACADKAPLVRAAPVQVGSAEPVRPGAVWEGVGALGNVLVDGIHRVAVAPGQPAEIEMRLTPSPRACADLVDGRCTAGCFEVMASAEFQGLLNLEVSPLDDAADVIAQNLDQGRVIAAGHCRGFALGHAGIGRVRVRVSASMGEGVVQVAAWRHRDTQSGPSAALTLRLPRLGTTKAQVLSEAPECASDWDPQRRECRFHGSVGPLPLGETCENGCTWWTYRFDEDDRLASVELSRSVPDVDDGFVGKFIDEAVWIAAALDEALGPSNQPESLETWAAVESPMAERGEPLVLQRRTWSGVDGATTCWQVIGIPGHHPVVELRVTIGPE